MLKAYLNGELIVNYKSKVENRAGLKAAREAGYIDEWTEDLYENKSTLNKIWGAIERGPGRATKNIKKAVHEAAKKIREKDTKKSK